MYTHIFPAQGHGAGHAEHHNVDAGAGHFGEGLPRARDPGRSSISVYIYIYMYICKYYI